MAKTFNIPSFLKYMNIDASDNNQIQVIHYDEHPNLLLKSEPVQLDFYLMALKDNIDVAPPIEEMSSAYIFLDKPGNILEWKLDKPFSGYAIFINSKLLDKFAKDKDSFKTELRSIIKWFLIFTSNLTSTIMMTITRKFCSRWLILRTKPIFPQTISEM